MAKTASKKPEKALLTYIPKRGGRARSGRITAWQRGGGSRKLWRQVEFGQKNMGVPGTVLAIEYDPNRNAHIALVEYENKERSYILAPHELNVEDTVVTSEEAEVKVGNRMRLAVIPVGTVVHNVELDPERGGRIARGAGAGVTVLAHDAGYTQLQMPSSEIRKVSSKSFASVGMVSNPEHRYQRAGKAGSTRLKGRRPKVRGTAMNPVDHPHGGGEGRTGRGMKYPKTRWGKPALGVKTRKRKWSDKLIVQRRKKKKKK